MTLQIDQSEAIRSIEAGTYPEMVAPAVSLYRRLEYERHRFDRVVSLAGALVLDVGGYDGCYRSVMYALGAERLVTIDRSEKVIDKGVEEGIIPRDDGFKGSLEDWLATNPPHADVAYVLNMMPGASRDVGFVRALSRVIKPGGILVTSFREPISAVSFSSLVESQATGFTKLHPSRPGQSAPPLDGMRNKFLYFWQKEE
jgi:SAM-dependent methyltransferase